MPDDTPDLDAMLNNPFRTFRPRNDAPARRSPVPPPVPSASPVPSAPGEYPEEIPERGEQPPAAPSPWRDRLAAAPSQTEEDRAERNHPLGLRVLALEKNEFVVAKKLDDLRRIVEHQNERIRLLEEELEIYRKTLDGGE